MHVNMSDSSRKNIFAQLQRSRSPTAPPTSAKSCDAARTSLVGIPPLRREDCWNGDVCRSGC
ncbi:hypothetical protein HMPREF0972_02002 [Actinomyces sp. oral taxon 848 str. F0332]|nr:hypothetical protein HMPREF0972_02002 [Actinomyces sp. oral taxon 848 str. F0332]